MVQYAVMQVSCEHCAAKYVLADSQVAGRTRVQFRCTKCGKATVVELAPQAVSQPQASEAGKVGKFYPDATPISTTLGLRLPEDKAIALFVIEGASKGLSFPMTKPCIVIGRRGGGADLEVDDQEVSGLHCAIESKADMLRLRDLDSMNGTYLDDKRVRAAELQHLAEFRIGSTVFLVTITPKAE